MAGRACHNDVDACRDAELRLRRLWAGGPLLPRCANHPQWPGQLHEVPVRGKGEKFWLGMLITPAARDPIRAHRKTAA